VVIAAADLYALQGIDLALDGASGRLAEIEEQLGESEELVEARQRVEEKRQAVAELRSRQADLEHTVDDVRAKASEVEKKLYGGSVRNPKELQDFQADLTALQGQVRKREDTLLAVLVEVEEGEGQLKEAESAFSQLEARWRAGQRKLEAEKGQIEPEIERLREKQAKQSSGIDKAALGLYRLLQERRGGQAVAMVERGMCQGCRITLPMSVLQRARAGLGLVQCVSCERILLVR